MKKMVIDGTYIYSGKGFSHTAIKKIRDGGIIELGYSSWEDNEQWIEVIEDNFFIGFINSKTKLIDLTNYCYVIENNLFCYEKPDFNSGIAVCLKRYDKIYLISKLFNKGVLWLKIYDRHGFCCYIDANCCICPNRFIPYSTTLNESTIMYITCFEKGNYKPIRLKKRSPIYVKKLIAYRPETGLDTNSYSMFINDNLKHFYTSDKVDSIFVDDEKNYLYQSNFLKNIGYSDDIWIEISAKGLTGYIPAITKTCTLPYLEHLPNEHLISNTSFHEDANQNSCLVAPGIISIVAGTLIFALLPAFSVFAVYFWILGICLIILKFYCS